MCDQCNCYVHKYIECDKYYCVISSNINVKSSFLYCVSTFLESKLSIFHVMGHTEEKPIMHIPQGQGLVSGGIHTREKEYLCIKCKAKISAKWGSILDKRTHAGEKPFQCTYCVSDISIYSKNKLSCSYSAHSSDFFNLNRICEIHVQNKVNSKINPKSCHITHTWEKPFKCNICENCCTNKLDLKPHLRIHTGEKPYQCSGCELCLSYYNTIINKSKCNHMGFMKVRKVILTRRPI